MSQKVINFLTADPYLQEFPARAKARYPVMDEGQLLGHVEHIAVGAWRAYDLHGKTLGESAELMGEDVPPQGAWFQRDMMTPFRLNPTGPSVWATREDAEGVVLNNVEPPVNQEEVAAYETAEKEYVQAYLQYQRLTQRLDEMDEAQAQGHAVHVVNVLARLRETREAWERAKDEFEG